MKKVLALSLLAIVGYQFVQGFNPEDTENPLGWLQQEQVRRRQQQIDLYGTPSEQAAAYAGARQQLIAQARRAGRGEGIYIRDLYDVIGVDRHATHEQIRRAWARKAKQLHKTGTQNEIQELNFAKNILTDPAARAAYDTELTAATAGGAAAAAATSHD